MIFNRELDFMEKLLRNFRLKMRYLTRKTIAHKAFCDNLGLQDILGYKYDTKQVFDLLVEKCEDNTIYQTKNKLLCNYILFKLPCVNEPAYICVGPYTTQPITRRDILPLAEKFMVQPGNLTQLEQFYNHLPLFSDDSSLLTAICTLGEYLWGSSDNFSIKNNLDMYDHISANIASLPDIHSLDDAHMSIQILEQRYAAEARLMQAVSNGQLHKVEILMTNISSWQHEERTGNQLRDLKNYAIIMNTILRKAAENATVHPVHINAISTQYARRIELIASKASFTSLIKEMARRYCLLVKNHSLKGYSLLVRKVIAHIYYDLTADLSLKKQAGILNVNPSYLSTLFKKETGMTLTNFVNKKRIEHAILLLNSTDMQIQTIAIYCGIPDVNYFSKIFKKLIGKTPKEYREMITAYS